MKAKIFDCSEKKFGNVDLDSKIWNSSFKPFLISMYNRLIISNERERISKTKNKSEVSGGGRKPWRQKGTGRARQGSIRSPQWKGGGVVFGPSGEQNYSIGMNKKERKASLFSILSKKASENEVLILENFKIDDYKTKFALSLLNDIGFLDKKILFVAHSSEKENGFLKKSFKNIKKVNVTDTKNLKINFILSSQALIFTKDSILEMESLLLP